MSESNFLNRLPSERLENHYQPSKPLFDASEARFEANRCLYCSDAPCIKACPTSIDIPKFIKQIENDNLRGAGKTIFSQNLLGSTCSSACPVEELCVGSCVYNELNDTPIQIGRLQQYATKHAIDSEKQSGRKLLDKKPSLGKEVALIGAGPASLSCAAELALNGVTPVIYERSSLPGGLNTTGIAPYKLKSEDALNEVEWLLSHGIEIKTGVEVGKDISAAELEAKYDAVFVGIGLGQDKLLDLPGLEGPGVFSATALIREIKNSNDFQIPSHVRRISVIGGGNTAIDVAREFAKLGKYEVQMIYRGCEDKMSGYKHELAGARKEAVAFKTNFSPTAILRNENGDITHVKVQSTSQDYNQNSELELESDWVVFAVGVEKFTFVKDWFAKLELDERSCIKVDESTFETNHPNVYAGGDCINGGMEVVNAVAHGRDAARSMIQKWI